MDRRGSRNSCTEERRRVSVAARDGAAERVLCVEPRDCLLLKGLCVRGGYIRIQQNVCGWVLVLVGVHFFLLRGVRRDGGGECVGI